MSSIKEIFKAWMIAMKPTPQQAELATKRLNICLGCEHYREKREFPGSTIIPQGIHTGPYCHDCGCPTEKKIFSPEKGACQLGKWNEIDGL